MQQATVGKTTLSPLNSGSCFSYELCGNRIVVRFLGIVPVKKIGLAEIRYLRVATRDEPAPLVFLLNWMAFYFNRRAYNPIYMLQTYKGKRYFMKLNTSAFQRLKKALFRFQKPARQTPKAA